MFQYARFPVWTYLVFQIKTGQLHSRPLPRFAYFHSMKSLKQLQTSPRGENASVTNENLKIKAEDIDDNHMFENSPKATTKKKIYIYIDIDSRYEHSCVCIFNTHTNKQIYKHIFAYIYIYIRSPERSLYLYIYSGDHDDDDDDQ
jgi:hypothetical protein